MPRSDPLSRNISDPLAGLALVGLVATSFELVLHHSGPPPKPCPTNPSSTSLASSTLSRLARGGTPLSPARLALTWAGWVASVSLGIVRYRELRRHQATLARPVPLLPGFIPPA